MGYSGRVCFPAHRERQQEGLPSCILSAVLSCSSPLLLWQTDSLSARQSNKTASGERMKKMSDNRLLAFPYVKVPTVTFVLTVGTFAVFFPVTFPGCHVPGHFSGCKVVGLLIPVPGMMFWFFLFLNLTVRTLSSRSGCADAFVFGLPASERALTMFRAGGVCGELRSRQLP